MNIRIVRYHIDRYCEMLKMKKVCNYIKWFAQDGRNRDNAEWPGELMGITRVSPCNMSSWCAESFLAKKMCTACLEAQSYDHPTDETEPDDIFDLNAELATIEEDEDDLEDDDDEESQDESGLFCISTYTIPRIQHEKSCGDFFHRTWRLKVLPVTNKSKQHRHQDQNRFTSLLLVTTGYVSLFCCRLCLQVVSQIWTGLETFGTGGEPSLPHRQDLEDDDDVATGGKGTNCWDIEVLWCLAWTWECWYCTLIFDDFWMCLNHKRDQRCRSRGRDGPQALWLPRFI